MKINKQLQILVSAMWGQYRMQIIEQITRKLSLILLWSGCKKWLATFKKQNMAHLVYDSLRCNYHHYYKHPKSNKETHHK